MGTNPYFLNIEYSSLTYLKNLDGFYTLGMVLTEPGVFKFNFPNNLSRKIVLHIKYLAPGCSSYTGTWQR